MSRLLTLALAAVLALSALPAGAAPVPVVASDNVELLFTLPDSVGAIATSFDPTRPLMYVNTLQGISIYDTTNPELPLLTGRLELPHFENEGMTLGQRADGTTFLLVGIDLVAVNPQGAGRFTTDGSSFYVADVTNAAAPKIVSFTDVPTSTHTISCMDPECRIAWTSGVYQGAKMTAIDLTDLAAPKVIGELKNINGNSFGVHQWTIDEGGLVVGTGGKGTGIYDISNPLDPTPLNTTDQDGGKSPYNDFIQHNGDRPNGDRLTPDMELEDQLALSADGYSVEDGNVLIVTEEDYDSPDCQGTTGVDAPEGGVSTWGIPYLDAAQHRTDNPTLSGTGGSIEALDTWNTELYDSGIETPAGALCSAHYFTVHDAGFIAQGWYGQGTRILDVRDAENITQVGYFIPSASEVWHAYWAPERDAAGDVTGNDTTVLYTNDVARGVDVLKVTLPTTAPEDTTPLVAPILPEWLDASAVQISTADASLGYMCRLAGVAAPTPLAALRPTLRGRR